MTPPATWTSTCRGPSGVCTVPPVMTRALARGSVKLEVGDSKERRIGDAGAADVLFAPLSAIEYDDEMDHVGARIPQDLRRPQRIAAGRHDVLDHRDAVAALHASFYLLRGSVALRFLATEDQREARFHRHCAAQEHRSELRCGEALRRERQESGQVLAQTAEQLGIGFEKELVEVSVGVLARTKDEITLQVRGRDQVPSQRLSLINHKVNLMDRSTPPGAPPRTIREAVLSPRPPGRRDGSAHGNSRPAARRYWRRR